jgi:hypothetical protein
VRWKWGGGKGIHRFCNRLVSASSCFVVAFFLKVGMGCMAKKDFSVSVNTFTSCLARSTSAYLLSDAFVSFLTSFFLILPRGCFNHCLYYQT